MNNFGQVPVKLELQFDEKRCRHYLNNNQMVLHCHHYLTLYTQLALDSRQTELLTMVSEESFFDLLRDQITRLGIENKESKIALCLKYYSILGLGKMELIFMGDNTGLIKLSRSHLDEGWIQKWGKYSKPINFVTSGYISAFFAIVFENPVGSYKSREVQSIISGNDFSLFKITRK